MFGIYQRFFNACCIDPVYPGKCKTMSSRLNMVCGTGGTHGDDMTTYYDVPPDLLIAALAVKLQAEGSISPPEWAAQVKTGTHRERPPIQSDWWHTRAAAVLRKVAMKGPIGANRISQEFGGTKDRGVKRNKSVAGSRNISRKILQQLTESGFVGDSMNTAGTVNHGKVVSPKGQSLLDDVAHNVRAEAEERYPELKRY